MKTILTSLICILFAAVNSFAQWTEQAVGIATTINSVSAVDDNVVWACGDFGKVLLTTNSGINWTVTSSPNVGRDFYTIKGIDALTALVGGGPDTAVIYKTTNGGSSWTVTFRQWDGFTDAIEGLNGFPGVYEFVGDPVGGRWSLFISYDYGLNWDSTGLYIPSVSGEAGWNNSFFAATPALFTFFGTTKTKLIQSYTNGTFVNIPTPGLTNSYSVWGNDNNRIMTGGNIMLYTTNSGTNWTNVNAIGSGSISAITGGDDKWFYTRGSFVYYSSNNGNNWSISNSASSLYTDLSLSPFGSYLWATHFGGISRFTFDTALPIELLSFVSTVSGRSVTLSWSTSREVNNSGFEIERLDVKSETQIDWKNIGFIKGIGNSEENSNYLFMDIELNQGKFHYRLKQIDFNGNFAYHNLSDEVIVGLPGKFRLSQNYPNPFNPSTKIKFDLQKTSVVKLSVYDMNGKFLQTIVAGELKAGSYETEWNASNYPSGVYFYRLETEGNTFSKRMMLVK